MNVKKHTTKVITSSQKHNWMTPPELFEKLHEYIHFELDPCAEKDNLGLSWYSKSENGLERPWCDRVCFVNPPYGSEQKKWIDKALAETRSVSVFLIPARVDTKLWQEVIFKKASHICFIKGRIKFIDPATGKKTNPSPFPSALVLFNANFFERKNFRRACESLGVIIK